MVVLGKQFDKFVSPFWDKRIIILSKERREE